MPPRRRSPGPAATVPHAVPPVVLSGPPGRITGTVSIANTGTEPLAVSIARVAPDGLPETGATIAAVVAPGTTHLAEVGAAYDPATPPGVYAARLDLHGQAREARVIIEANPSNTVRPNRIHVSGPSGDRVTVELEVANTGNVPVPLARTVTAPTVVVVPFGIDHGPALALALAIDGRDAPVLPPGETRTVTATLTLPQELDRSRRHQALVPVGMADLRVFVLPRDPDPVPPKPTPVDPTPGPRATTRSRVTSRTTRRSTPKEPT